MLAWLAQGASAQHDNQSCRQRVGRPYDIFDRCGRPSRDGRGSGRRDGRTGEVSAVGSADASARDLLRQDVYFADVFNYLVYGGDEVVRPEGLRELDTASLVMPFGDGARYAVQRYRDVLKSWGAMSDGNAAYLLLGIEEQTKVHYGMPVRCALYDAISYADQIAKSKRSYSDRRKEGALSVRGRKRRRKGAARPRRPAASPGTPSRARSSCRGCGRATVCYR